MSHRPRLARSNAPHPGLSADALVVYRCVQDDAAVMVLQMPVFFLARKYFRKIATWLQHQNESLTRLIGGWLRIVTLIQCFDRPASSGSIY
jgi:hypothetical protein